MQEWQNHRAPSKGSSGTISHFGQRGQNSERGSRLCGVTAELVRTQVSRLIVQCSLPWATASLPIREGSKDAGGSRHRCSSHCSAEKRRARLPHQVLQSCTEAPDMFTNKLCVCNSLGRDLPLQPELSCSPADNGCAQGPLHLPSISIPEIHPAALEPCPQESSLSRPRQGGELSLVRHFLLRPH